MIKYISIIILISSFITSVYAQDSLYIKPKNGNSTSINLSKIKKITFPADNTFLVEFKDIAYENTNFYIKKNIFNDDKAYFDNFIDLLIRLVFIKINDKIDLTGRIHMSELLCHEFFTKKI